MITVHMSAPGRMPMRATLSPSPCIKAPIHARITGPSTLGMSITNQGRSSTAASATQMIGGAFGGANEVFVAGSESQQGARVVQKLLQAGFKVVAGVGDEERAQAAVDFAASVELLKKDEVQKLRLEEIDLADEESIAAALPKRRARVVAVVGEAGKGGSKLDARGVSRLLEASQEVGASQFVLVTPTGSGGGGGFLGGLFGGGGGSVGGSGSKTSKIEEDIASSGLEFAIIRTGRTDGKESDFEAESNVAVGAQGSLPAQSRISKTQVAEVVQQVLRLANESVLIEAWASPDSPAVQIEEAISEVLPEATVKEEEQPESAATPVEAEIDEEEEVKPARRGGFGGFGTKRLKVGDDVDDEEEEEAPKPKGGLFGFGTQRLKVGDDSSASKPSPSARRSRGAVSQNGAGDAPAKAKRSIFGIGKKVQEEVEEEVPAKAKRAAFGFGRKAQEVEEEVEDATYNPKGALSKLFGSKKPVEQAEMGVDKARKSASRGVKAAGKAAGRAADKTRPGGDEKPAKKGFLASIGMGSEYNYVSDDD